MPKKVIIGLSGGVDSSVAAFLLLQEGYEVEGLFMKNWDQDDTSGYCPAAEDLKDAQAVCDVLQIPLHTINFSEAYWQKVFTHFLDEYHQNRTPNPDILCNKEIKFKAFLDHALTLGADFIATGHYARIKQDAKGSFLYKAKDRNKDQSYFLHAVHKAAFEKTLFPLSTYLKSEVRAIAKAQGFLNHAKKDSTGICFIGERRFKTFLNEYVLAQPGPIQSSNGETLGRHDGLMFYTYGQRQGLHIGGTKGNTQDPWYVVDKIPETNTLMVAQGKNHPLLFSRGLICGSIHWLTEQTPDFPLTCFAKTRYRQDDQACLISPPQNQQHIVFFADLQRAITPGQYIVFYNQNQCLGGAVIEEIIRA